MDNGTQHDPLLMETLRGLRSAVDRVQDSQDQMRDKLHASILENTKLTSGIEDKLTAKMTDALKPLATRVQTLEDSTRDFEVKAKKWGAIGGAGAVVTAGLTAVVAVFSKSLSGK
jgi:hypothetical protein